MRPDLIPHKRALGRLGLSRTSVWRAMHSNIEGFPAPVVVRGRLYWRETELDALDDAMMRYLGRCAFEAGARARPRQGKLQRAAERTASPVNEAEPEIPEDGA